MVDMDARRSRNTGASAVAVLAIVALDAAATIAELERQARWAHAVALVLVTLVPTATGLLVLRGDARNVVGRLLIAQGLLVALALDSEPLAYATWVTPHLAVAGWLGLLTTDAWPLLYLSLMLIAFRFPDGRFTEPRWRLLALSSCAAAALFILSAAFATDRFGGALRRIDVPLPRLADALVIPGLALGMLGILAGLIGAALAARSRLRAATGSTRLQMLWFVYATLIIPGALGACIIDRVIHGDPGEITFAAVCVMGTVLPAAIGIAVLRHGLFDIELVLSHTLVFATLTSAVVTVYALIVLGAGSVIGDRGVAGLVAVGVVAVVIQPLHARVRRRVARWAYGDRADPYAALDRLTSRVQASVAPEEIVQTLVDSVSEALRVSRVAIEVDGGEVGRVVAAEAGRRGSGAETQVPLIHQSETVGRLVVETAAGRPLTGADRRLLDDLARHAGAAAHAVRLTLGLQRSRERLVSAREEERRRLRRDLHDGVGPALAAIGLKLDVARAAVSDEAPARLLGELREETREAIADIRRLVYELRPPALDDLGLLGAIGRQADQLSRAAPAGGLTAVVDGPPCMPRLPAAIEVAAYRIALEAMTNVVRHSGAKRCVVTVAVNGALELTVADNGRGVPAGAVAGVGRSSMRERAEELGGRLEISGRPGGGTLVHALLPIPAPP